MSKFKFLTLGAALLLGGATATNLHLAAASSLNQVLPELISTFERQHPEITVFVNYGASGSLSQQIKLGAPFDVFLSASPSYIDFLSNFGLVANRQAFARGKLALFYKRNSDRRIARLNDLIRDEINKIAVANPQYAPYGQAALNCLEYYKIYEKLKPKLVYAASVSQAAQMAIYSTDAAFIALPLALTQEMLQIGSYLEVPCDCYRPLILEAAVIKDSDYATQFVNFLTTPEALGILRSHGYETP